MKLPPNVVVRALALLLIGCLANPLAASVIQPLIEATASPVQEDDKTLRVFLFAGQSNMVGADSKAKDIERFAPFRGLDEPQKDVKFSYCIGRENKTKSDGWVDLQPIKGMVGPELSFAREVKRHVKAPIAIIKVAAGGTGGFGSAQDQVSNRRIRLAPGRKRHVRRRRDASLWRQLEEFHRQLATGFGAARVALLCR